MRDCDGKELTWGNPEQPCTPGPVLHPACYVVPPDEDVLSGYIQLTLAADCTVTSSVILNDALAPVAGAAQVSCPGVGGGGGGGSGPAGPPGPPGISACEIAETFPQVLPQSTDVFAIYRPGDDACYSVTAANVLNVPFVVQEDNVVVSDPTLCINFQDGIVATIGNTCDVDVNLSYYAGTMGQVSAAAGVPGVSTAVARGDHTHQLNLNYYAGVMGPASPALATPGVSTAVARGDHTHQTPTGTPVATGVANAPGILDQLARADHVHRTLVRFLDEGTLVASRPGINFIGAAVTVTDDVVNDRVNVTLTPATSQISVSDNGSLISSTVTEINFVNGLSVSGGPSTVSVNLQYGSPTVPVDAAAATPGTAFTVMRSDAKLQAATAVPVSTGTVNTLGVATTLARSDHIHRTLVGWQDEGTLIAQRPTVNFVGGSVTVTDDAGNDRTIVTIADPVAQITVQENGTAVSSSVTTLNYQNGIIATGGGALISLNLDYGSPAALADAATATPGVSSKVLRADAKLQVATGTPVSTGQVNAPGSASTLARSDHVHRTLVQLQEEGALVSTRPTINFVGAAVTVTDDVGGDRSIVTITAPSPTITTQENGVNLSTTVTTLNFNNGIVASGAGATTTLNLDYGSPTVAADAAAATAGTSNQVLRSDAKLQVATGTPVTIGTANAAGAATTLARSDHVHRGAVPFSVNGTAVATEPGLNLIPGSNITITAVDNPGSNRVDYTISSAPLSGAEFADITPDEMRDPKGSAPVGPKAEIIDDSTFQEVRVARFDDGNREGVTWQLTIPSGKTSMTLLIKGKARNLPAGTVGVVMGMYVRRLPDDAAVPAWSALTTFATLSVPADLEFHYYTRTVTLASLGAVAGELHVFEFIRDAPNVADTLVNDFAVAEIIQTFS
jgi:hypothetical protein